MVLAHGILHKLAIAITLAIHTSGDASNASHVLIHPSAAMAKAVRSEAFLRVDPITCGIRVLNTPKRIAGELQKC